MKRSMKDWQEGYEAGVREGDRQATKRIWDALKLNEFLKENIGDVVYSEIIIDPK